MWKDSGIVLEDTEEKDILLILTRIGTATQALRLDVLPKDTPTERIRAYMYGICDSLAEAKFLEVLWRRRVSTKYNLPDNFIYENYKIYLPQITAIDEAKN